MNSEAGRSQGDTRNYHSSQVRKEEQSDYNTYQIKVEPRKRANDITNTQNQQEYSPKKCRQHQTTSPNQRITITLDGNDKENKNMKHQATDRKTDRSYEARISANAVNEEIESQKSGCINFGLSLCFPGVDITFSETKSEESKDKQVSGWQNQVCTDCIEFYVYAVGKRNERILKDREEGNKLCVRGFKGETIKDTLRKDGRFCSFVESDHWKLVKDLDIVIENTQLVDELEGKLFQVEVERKKYPQAADSTDLEKPSYCTLKEYIVDEYPMLKRECEKLRAYIRKESEKPTKTSSFEMHKANFRKLTKNSTPAKVLKLLSRFSDSVGLLVWNNDGNEGCATCFVFTGLYIFTCRHVINDIVGKDVEQSKWADTINQCAKVTFDYEESLANEDNCFFSVEPWFGISDETLDYAVLKLKENEQQIPAGLYNGTTPVPSSGLIYMIGQPDMKQKHSDGCAVVSLDEHAQEREAAEDSATMQYIHMYTQRSFQETVHEPGVLARDNTFYCGSSGSPVFDSKGSLVAMHTAGFICEYESGVSSIIEFGTAMESILTDIKQKHETWYNEECVNRQDVEMNSLDY
ncbi:serine protease FAM111A-like [Psammomys obesus]|uniref:serine protease FAM111A-like n=1 Tax=Psammomys obesus TaxID=48139 RepID=UPI002452DCB6|nr:serine protease FAM111A-like [Psammomys obesus]